MTAQNNDSDAKIPEESDNQYVISGCQTCPCQHELNGPCCATEHGSDRNAATALPYDGFPDDCPLDEMDWVFDEEAAQRGRS